MIERFVIRLRKVNVETKIIFWDIEIYSNYYTFSTNEIEMYVALQLD